MLQIAHPKKAGTEKQPLNFGDNQFSCFGFIQQRLCMVGSFEIDDFPLAREFVEVIKIERPIDRVQSENALIAFAGVDDLDLKELERNIEVGHRFQRAGGGRPQNIREA